MGTLNVAKRLFASKGNPEKVLKPATVSRTPGSAGARRPGEKRRTVFGARVPNGCKSLKNVIEYMYYIVGKKTNQANIQILLMVRARSTSSSSSFFCLHSKLTDLSTCSAWASSPKVFTSTTSVSIRVSETGRCPCVEDVIASFKKCPLPPCPSKINWDFSVSVVAAVRLSF